MTRLPSQGVELLKQTIALGLLLALAVPLEAGVQQHSNRPSSERAVSAVNMPCSPSAPNHYSPPVKITDQLALSIPLRYTRQGWLSCNGPGSSIVTSPNSNSTGASFEFFLPDFSGYTVERYQERFDQNEVQVAYVVSASAIEVNPDDPAHIPSNQLQNMLRWLADSHKYRDLDGLRCYEARILKNEMYCYGVHDDNEHGGLFFEVRIPPFPPGMVNPQMRTDYYSKRYGGIEIAWRTNVKNLPRWREIDGQIWKFLASWNVAHR